MAWIILEGIDRSGKSTVAELYKSKGFEVVHMSAPSKKYAQEGYAGPSYLDDLIDQVMTYDGKDVVWDRSWYGEFIWPQVYGRKPMLTPDDLEVIQEFENRNNTQKIMMVDPDKAGHWKRCVDNKEPLNHPQFNLASTLYSRLAHSYNFTPRELADYKHELKTDDKKQAGAADKQEGTKPNGQAQAPIPVANVPSSKQDAKAGTPAQEATLTQEEKLERANAINEVLAARIIKKKGDIFDQLESDVKNFLRVQLSSIFNGQPKTVSLTEEEVSLVKLFCQRLKEKEGKK